MLICPNSPLASGDQAFLASGRSGLNSTLRCETGGAAFAEAGGKDCDRDGGDVAGAVIGRYWSENIEGGLEFAVGVCVAGAPGRFEAAGVHFAGVVEASQLLQ